MNSIQQPQLPPLAVDEKDEVTTQAGSHPDEEAPSSLQRVLLFTPVVGEAIVRQQDICAKLTLGTFSADKLVRLISSLIKLTRTYNLVNKAKPLEKLAAEIGQMRRLLRVDRLFQIIKDFVGYAHKKKLKNMDKFMLAFKTMILVGDVSDLTAFLIQLKVVRGEEKMAGLRQRIGDLYFLECVGWLVLHGYEYCRAETEEDRKKNGLLFVRYLMDAVTASNDFSYRRWSINPKVGSAIGVLSSLLNLYLIWK